MEISPYVTTRALVIAFGILVAGLCVWWFKRRARKAREFGEVLRKRTQ